MQINRATSFNIHRTGSVKMNKINVIFLLALGVLGFIYLVFINRLAMQGYAMRDLEKRVAVLKEINQKMELELAELRSIEGIKDKAIQFGLVPAAKIQYIKASSGVALNK